MKAFIEMASQNNCTNGDGLDEAKLLGCLLIACMFDVFSHLLHQMFGHESCIAFSSFVMEG